MPESTRARSRDQAVGEAARIDLAYPLNRGVRVQETTRHRRLVCRVRSLAPHGAARQL